MDIRRLEGARVNKYGRQLPRVTLLVANDRFVWPGLASRGLSFVYGYGLSIQT